MPSLTRLGGVEEGREIKICIPPDGDNWQLAVSYDDERIISDRLLMRHRVFNTSNRACPATLTKLIMY